MTDKRLIPKILITNTQNITHTTQYKINNPILKMSRRHKQAFFQKRYTDGKQAQEKMLNII